HGVHSDARGQQENHSFDNAAVDTANRGPTHRDLSVSGVRRAVPAVYVGSNEGGLCPRLVVFALAGEARPTLCPTTGDGASTAVPSSLPSSPTTEHRCFPTRGPADFLAKNSASAKKCGPLK